MVASYEAVYVPHNQISTLQGLTETSFPVKESI